MWYGYMLAIVRRHRLLVEVVQIREIEVEELNALTHRILYVPHAKQALVVNVLVHEHRAVQMLSEGAKEVEKEKRGKRKQGNKSEEEVREEGEKMKGERMKVSEDWTSTTEHNNQHHYPQ